MATEEEKAKAYGQARLQLNGVMEPFNQYGLGIHITPAIEQILEIFTLLRKRLNGEDIPITLSLAEARRRKRYMK